MSINFNPQQISEVAGGIIAQEKELGIFLFNNTTVTYPQKTFLDLFQENVDNFPDDSALQYENKAYTFKELHLRSSAIAEFLLSQGVSPGSVIGVFMERSLDMMATIIGIMKAECAFLPIDTKYPILRVKYILNNSRVQTVLTDKTGIMHQSFQGFDGALFDVAEIPIDFQYITRPIPQQSLAYVIYTSASTGDPKGVMITHDNLSNFIFAMREKVGFERGRALLMMAPISFDLSISETLLPLAFGVKVILANHQEQRDPYHFNHCIVHNNVSILHATPSRLNAFLNDKNQLQWLNYVEDLIVGGEAFTLQLFQNLNTCYKGRLFNFYGPTEATVWATYKQLRPNDALNIGKPLGNYCIHIVDAKLASVPVGESGELCIGGKGVATGYLNSEALTAEKFILLPDASRIYRTGDLAKWTADGEIEFLGRLDHQVKIRGFRVDLGEVQKRINEIPGILQAQVVARNAKEGVAVLCCYYISQQRQDIQMIKEHLLLYVPDYMVPSHFYQIDEFLLNINGKIDWEALPLQHVEKVDISEDLIEKQLFEIWEEVIGVKIDSANSDFFESGGHSLSAVILLGKIQEVYKIRIPLAQFFQIATVRDLANHLRMLAEV